MPIYQIIRERKYLQNFRKKKLKKNIICYSNKSNDFVKKISNYTNYKMIELKNLNSSKIINIFQKTKIYLDFGYHPGKDRMPREAVLFNNCILTNKRGSAGNNMIYPLKNSINLKNGTQI